MALMIVSRSIENHCVPSHLANSLWHVQPFDWCPNKPRMFGLSFIIYFNHHLTHSFISFYSNPITDWLIIADELYICTRSISGVFIFNSLVLKTVSLITICHDCAHDSKCNNLFERYLFFLWRITTTPCRSSDQWTCIRSSISWTSHFGGCGCGDDGAGWCAKMMSLWLFNPSLLFWLALPWNIFQLTKSFKYYLQAHCL